MKIEIKKLPQSLIEIKGEVSSEDFEKHVREAISQYSQETEIPGFRKGNVPEKVLIERMGENKILEKGARIAFQSFYPQILKEHQIEAIGLPEFHILKLARHNPLEFKIIIALLPEVQLPDYKKFAREIFEKKEEVKVEEKEVQERLGQFKKLLEARSGKKEELNDEFAKKLGNFQNLEELKKVILQNLEFEKKTKIRDEKRIKLLEEVAKEIKVDLPQVLIEGEKRKMVEELKRSIMEMGLGWEDYLKQIKKTEEDLLKSFLPEATRRVNFGLILREIAKQEKIEVKEEEIKRFIDNYQKVHPKEKVDQNYIYGLIKNEKTFALLETLA